VAPFATGRGGATASARRVGFPVPPLALAATRTGAGSTGLVVVPTRVCPRHWSQFLELATALGQYALATRYVA